MSPPNGKRLLAILAGLAAFAIVFGLGIWTATVPPSAPHGFPPYRAAVTSSQPSTALATPSSYRIPCDDPVGEQESAICATWRAAFAAEDSANWAMWGFCIAIIGSVALLRQIMLTREAVEASGEATEAMRESNAFAKDTAYRQMRAYVNCTGVAATISETGDGITTVECIATFKNAGVTPADVTTESIYVRVFKGGPFSCGGGHISPMSNRLLGPGADYSIKGSIGSQTDSFVPGDYLRIEVLILIKYTDYQEKESVEYSHWQCQPFRSTARGFSTSIPLSPVMQFAEPKNAGHHDFLRREWPDHVA